MAKSKTKPLGLKQLLSEARTDEERQAILDGLPHEVGFAKPPKSTRFKKGQSGNPKGRTKGALNLATVLSNQLNEKIEVKEGGRVRKKTKGEVLVTQVVNKAAGGDLKASITVFDWQRKAGLLGESAVPEQPVFDAETVKRIYEIKTFYETDRVKPADEGGE